MNFQKVVLTIAIIILIIMLIFVGMSLSKLNKNEVWPPNIGACPDYWEDISGNGSMCINSHSLGKCNLPTSQNLADSAMNFDKNPFLGANGICAKYKWATACGVTWDGITSGVNNPCKLVSN